MNPSPRLKWIVLLASFLAQFSFLFLMQSVPPILPEIMKEFSVDYSTASTLMLLVALPSVALSLFAGYLGQRYGVKRATTIGLILVSAGSIASVMATTFTFLQASRLIMGIGGALVTVIAPISVYQFFETKQMGLAMGVTGQVMPFATVIAFNSLGIIQILSGWRTVLTISAVISIICTLIYVATVREKKSKNINKLELKALSNTKLWIVGLIWGFFNMASVSYGTWAKTLFTQFNGLPPTYSDFLASAFMIGGFACPVAGFLSDKTGKRRIFLIISTAGITSTFAAFSFIDRSLFLPFALMLGTFDFLLPSVILALPEEIIGKENGGIAMGVLSSCMNIGIVIGPTLIGALLDLTGNGTLSFLALACYMGVALILSLALKTR